MTNKPSRTFQAGDQVLGFTVQSVDSLAEFQAQGIHLRHNASGLEIYHVANGDEENLFSFCFKTLPQDSTGVAHILEHSVLCGSERYPLKDPFVLLLKGSMNTFLNALTFPDKTMYPASSTVAADLFNLAEVYGDAVWFPLLQEEVFLQEGHRLEFDEADQLQRIGIVYNEMKGNYSTHDSLAADACMRSLFPGSAYGHDSGGDPQDIPKLDYPTFLAFHRSHYHPSNTKLFLYGDIPTEQWLTFLNDRFLHRFDFSTLPTLPDPQLLAVEPWARPRQSTITFPAGPENEDKTGSCTLNWLLGSISETDDLLGIEVLTELLVGSAASPLQRALVDSGIGDDLSSVTGLETELSRLIFSVGLRGTALSDSPQVEALVLSTLESIAQDGFDHDLIEGTLRRFEFHSREIKGGPFGLRLLRRSMRAWLHGAPPRLTTEFSPRMAELRTKLQNQPRYFENLIQSQFLDNPHRSTVNLVPDEDQNNREESQVRSELDAIAAALSPEQAAEIRRKTAALKLWQEREDDPEVLAQVPFLAFKDIPVTVRTLPIAHRHIDLRNGMRIGHVVHELFSNGITYLDIVNDISHLDPLELALTPLFVGMVPALGSQTTDYETMATQLNLYTGGFGSYCETSLDIAGQLSKRVFWRLKTLDADLAKGFSLVSELLLQTDFSDQKRLIDLFKENRNENRSSLLPSGNAYAGLRTERSFSTCQALEELFRGISQILFLEDLEKTAGDALPAVLQAIFSHLSRRILVRQGCIINSAGDAQALDRCQGAASTLLERLDHEAASSPSLAAILNPLLPPGQSDRLAAFCHNALTVPALNQVEALTLPSKVAFAALSFPAATLKDPDYVADNVLCHLLRTGEFWSRIRMKGGAYGASASTDGFCGTISFSSYRDPHIAETFQAFADSLQAIASLAPDDQELLLAKISLVARELRPNSPSEASFTSLRRLLYGISDTLRQKNRDLLLSLSPSAIAKSAKRAQEALEKAQRAVIAGAEMVDKETRQNPTLAFKTIDICPL